MQESSSFLYLGQSIKIILMEQEGLSLKEAAARLRLTSPFLLNLIQGKTTLTPDMAARLFRLLETQVKK